MKLAIVGSRDFPRLDCVEAFVRGLPEGSYIISGGARGVDQTAESAAVKAGLEVGSYRVRTVYRPDHVIRGYGTFWHHHPAGGAWEPPFDMRVEFPHFGRTAYARNRLIVGEADIVVAFWDGQSKGTKHAIGLANEMGKRVELAGKDA